MQADDVRLLHALLGAIAFGLISWRLISCWLQTTVLVHVLGLLLASSLLISAIAAAELVHRADAPLTVALQLSIVHRVATIGVALMWPRWANRRDAPWKRTRSV